MSGAKPDQLAKVRVPPVGPEQRRALALEVARRFGRVEPATAGMLLEMLGLVDETGTKTW